MDVRTETYSTPVLSRLHAGPTQAHISKQAAARNLREYSLLQPRSAPEGTPIRVAPESAPQAPVSAYASLPALQP